MPNYDPMADENLVADIVGRVVTKQRDLMRQISFAKQEFPSYSPKKLRKTRKLQRNESIGRTYKQTVTLVQPAKKPNHYESVRIVPYTVSTGYSAEKERESSGRSE